MEVSGFIYSNSVTLYKSAKKMLQSFTDEQLQMTQKFINPEYWSSKFKSYPADLLFVQETAKGAKIE